MLEARTAPVAATFPTPSLPETPSTPLKTDADPFAPLDTFARRHIGPQPEEVATMLELLGFASLDDLVEAVVPPAIRLRRPLELPAAKGEREALEALRGIMAQNKVFRSFIGQGYYDTITPPVIQRNILENPGWYTAYTPYQAEIAQGRLEALLNFQTMVADLTGLGIANASLLDEATAAAEAMTMLHSVRVNPAAHRFFVSIACHPQTLDVLRTRAVPQGIELVIDAAKDFNRLYSIANAKSLQATSDPGDLSMALFEQQMTFIMLIWGIEARLMLDGIVPFALDLGPLMSAIEGLAAQTRTLARPQFGYHAV